MADLLYYFEIMIKLCLIFYSFSKLIWNFEILKFQNRSLAITTKWRMTISSAEYIYNWRVVICRGNLLKVFLKSTSAFYFWWVTLTILLNEVLSPGEPISLALHISFISTQSQKQNYSTTKLKKKFILNLIL